jgi:hypothetical protein
MLIILIFERIGIFLVTNLPLNIAKIILPRGQVITDAYRLTTIWTVLGWFESLNYAVCIFIPLKSLHVYLSEFLDQFLCTFSQFNIISYRIQTTNEIFIRQKSNCSTGKCELLCYDGYWSS